MKIKTFSYRFAEEILCHPTYKAVYDELLYVCKNCPLPVYKGKSTVQKTKDVVQQIMNTYFRLSFVNLGWEEEPLATPDDYEDALRADFRKTFKITTREKITVQIEVEFGNAASLYRDYFKFQLSFSNSLTDVCVLIVPSEKICQRIDTGVACFEKVCREIPSSKLSTTVPILVIGLFDEGVAEWDVKKEQPNLEICKGAKNSTKEKHNELVNSYIDRIVMSEQTLKVARPDSSGNDLIMN